MSVYVISDTHFDHDNILKYCDRPFNSGREMNRELIRRWNETVSSSDTVLFGGDLSIASSAERAVELDEALNGCLVLLKGNHDGFDDSDVPFSVQKSLYFTYEFQGKEYEFYYSHFPSDYQERTTRDDSRSQPKYARLPRWFDGWNLHGHVHNNDMTEYPFLNHVEKSINVGADVTGFRPVSVEELVASIREGEWIEKFS